MTANHHVPQQGPLQLRPIHQHPCFDGSPIAAHAHLQLSGAPSRMTFSTQPRSPMRDSSSRQWNTRRAPMEHPINVTGRPPWQPCSTNTDCNCDTHHTQHCVNAPATEVAHLHSFCKLQPDSIENMMCSSRRSIKHGQLLFLFYPSTQHGTDRGACPSPDSRTPLGETRRDHLTKHVEKHDRRHKMHLMHPAHKNSAE
jgi:hypothetical protein